MDLNASSKPTETVQKQTLAAPPPKPFPRELLEHLAAGIDSKSIGNNNNQPIITSSQAAKALSALEDCSAQSLREAMAGASKEKSQHMQGLLDRLMFMGKKEEDARSDAVRDLERRDSETSEKSSTMAKTSFTDKMSSGWNSMFTAANLTSLGNFGKKDEARAK